jgi:tryptophan synthase alpha chain
MNRIDELFQRKKSGVFSVYFTAGFPQLNDTVKIITGLERAGVDLIEVGMPFSDPLADGPVIQESSTIALRNGMGLDLLFEQLKNIRQKAKLPLVLMGYMNPVLQYGVENFCRNAAACGIDGLILPDMPPEIYATQYKQLFDQYGLHHILLITPRTDEERIHFIDSLSGGFLYAVSSSSTTGNKEADAAQQDAYFHKISAMKLKNPVMIGFGISSHHQFENACKFASGAIVGSAFIRKLSLETDPLQEIISDFVIGIKPDQP